MHQRGAVRVGGGILSERLVRVLSVSIPDRAVVSAPRTVRGPPLEFDAEWSAGDERPAGWGRTLEWSETQQGSLGTKPGRNAHAGRPRTPRGARMGSGKKRKRKKIATHKRKKRLRKNRHKKRIR